MFRKSYLLGFVLLIVLAVGVYALFKNDLNSASHSSDKKTNFLSGVLPSKSNVIGYYNGKSVSDEDLSSDEKQSLFESKSQLFKEYENIVAKRYFDEIITSYGKEKGISDKSLAQQTFIREKITVSDEKIKKFISENAENPQLKGKKLQEQENLVKPFLIQKEASNYFKTLLSEGEQTGKIQVTALEKPKMPRLSVEIGNSPSIGNHSAKIKIVEFADYQCPFCATAEVTMKQVLDKYKDHIQFSFKNFPLVQIHPQALGAAVAAECANQQGKFWEMHDKLFLNHNKLSKDLFSSLAVELKLDKSKFDSCSQSSTAMDSIHQDMEYGQSLGINATPVFFINGLMLNGAQPFSEFQSIIESELSKK